MRLVLPGLLLVACGSPEPHWAHDTLTLVPLDDGLSATQDWALYGPRWARSLNERQRVCTFVYELGPEPITADCEGCTDAWSVSPVLADGDCLPRADTTFTALRRLGVDPDGPTLWMDVGADWEVHSTPEGTWDGEQPLSAPADHAWELLDDDGQLRTTRP